MIIFFRLVSVRSGLLGFVSVCVETGSEAPKSANIFSFAKKTNKEPKKIEFQFVSVWTKNKNRLFKGSLGKFVSTLYIDSCQVNGKL